MKVSSVLNGLRGEQFGILLEYNVAEVKSSGIVIFPLYLLYYSWLLLLLLLLLL